MNKLIQGVPVKDYFADLVNKEVDVEADNPAFRCFKNKFHVYPLTKLMFLISISCWLLVIGIAFPWSILILWLPIAYFFITIFALKHRRAACMWPAVIHCLLLVLIWLATTIVLLSTALFSTQTFLDSFGQGHHQQFIVRFMITLMIKTVIVLIGVYLVYQLMVFNVCRKYFDHIRNADLPAAHPEEATELKVIEEKS